MAKIKLDNYYTVSEAMKIIKVSRQRIHQLIHSEWEGECDYVGEPPNTTWLIPKKLVEGYERTSPIPTSEQVSEKE